MRGTLAELAGRYAKETALGEVTLVVEGRGALAPGREARLDLDEASIVEVLREAGLSLKQAAGVAGKLTGRGRREVYQEALRKRRPDRD